MNQKERISQRMQLEDQLQYRLDNVMEKIKYDGLRQTGDAKRLYDSEVTRTLRASIEDAYQLGIDYVTDKRNTVGFLTDADLKIIRDQVFKYSESFWRKVDRVIHRNDVLLQKNNYVPRSPLNSNYLATSIAIGAVTTTLALATRQKALILKSQIKGARVKCPKGKHWDIKQKKCVDDEQIGVPIPFLPTEDEIDDLLVDTAPLALTSLLMLTPGGVEDIEEVITYMLQWNAILDSATCPVCANLDGSTWEIDDPTAPTPGDDGDIHVNCRCFYDLIEV